MAQLKNNFGIRLRRLVEQRGTIESAYEKLGVSRATLFNWFDRDEPPPGPLMLEKLRRYLGAEASEFLDELDDSLREEPAPYGRGLYQKSSTIADMHRPFAQEPSDAMMLRYFTEALGEAGEVPGGRGYVWSILKLHLSPEQIRKLKD